MENSAKALEIAGGVLITILVISICVMVYNNMKVMPNAQEEALSTEQLTKYNMQFTAYEGSDRKGAEVITVINKAIDENKKNGDAKNSTAPYYTEVILNFNTENPLVEKVYKYELQDNKWKQTNEKNATYTGAVNLTKNSYNLENDYYPNENSSELAKFIKLNYSSSSTYEMINCNEYGELDDNDEIFNMRYETGVYYRKNNLFAEFKRKVFDCSIEYNDNGRVNKITFTEK